MTRKEKLIKCAKCCATCKFYCIKILVGGWACTNRKSCFFNTQKPDFGYCEKWESLK